jgi:hypothetical protein
VALRSEPRSWAMEGSRTCRGGPPSLGVAGPAPLDAPHSPVAEGGSGPSQAEGGWGFLRLAQVRWSWRGQGGGVREEKLAGETGVQGG